MALETCLDPPLLHGKCHLKFPFWFSAHLPKRSSWLPWQIPRLQRIQSSRKKEMFSSAVSQIDYLHIFVLKIYPQKLLIVWNLKNWTIFPVRTDPHTNTFMALEQPCHLFYLNSLSSSSEQWTILMFMFVNVRVKRICPELYVCQVHSADVSWEDKTFPHTISSDTTPCLRSHWK